MKSLWRIEGSPIGMRFCRRLVHLGLAALLPVFLLSCITTGPPRLQVGIDAIRSPEPDGRRIYVLYSSNPLVAHTDLQFREFAAYAHRALQARGFVPVSDPKKAELALYLSYGISGPYTEEQIYAVPRPGYDYWSFPYRRWGGIGWPYNDWSYGYPGYMLQTVRVTTYQRFLTIDAYDYGHYRSQGIMNRHLWRTSVSSVGESYDLRRIFPVLMAAAEPYLGTDTTRQIEREIEESDPNVLRIKGIPLSPPSPPGQAAPTGGQIPAGR